MIGNKKEITGYLMVVLQLKRLLEQLYCDELIDSLISWMTSDISNEMSDKKFV